jgi:hypothetical protein
MHVVSGGGRCAGEEDMEEILGCIDDVSELDTELAAVHAVAGCYREVCTVGGR